MSLLKILAFIVCVFLFPSSTQSCINAGNWPAGKVLETRDGSLVGITKYGGNDGNIFSLNKQGKCTILYNFRSMSEDGHPNGNLIQLKNNDIIYGTTWRNIYTFDLKKSEYKSVYTFPRSKGWPLAGLYEANNNLLYGSTIWGSNNCGLIFSFSPSHPSQGINIVYEMKKTDGCAIHDSLIQSGNYLYGTTVQYGLYEEGTIFRMSTIGDFFQVLHNFEPQVVPSGSYHWGATDLAGLIPSSKNSNLFYSVRSVGGKNNVGLLYSITSDGHFTVLHEFSEAEGSFPGFSLVEIKEILYGVTSSSVFNYNIKTSQFTVMHVFSTTHEHQPDGGLLLDSKGYLIGTVSQGGISNEERKDPYYRMRYPRKDSVHGSVFLINPTKVSDNYQILYNFTHHYG